MVLKEKHTTWGNFLALWNCILICSNSTILQHMWPSGKMRLVVHCSMGFGLFSITLVFSAHWHSTRSHPGKAAYYSSLQGFTHISAVTSSSVLQQPHHHNFLVCHLHSTVLLVPLPHLTAEGQPYYLYLVKMSQPNNCIDLQQLGPVPHAVPHCTLLKQF